MEMADTGMALSGGAVGVIGTVITAYLRSKVSGARKPAAVRATLEPDPLRVEIQKTYATKDELRELDERVERRFAALATTIREDITGLRMDIKENDARAEARSVATHKRIDAVKDLCASRGACK